MNNAYLYIDGFKFPITHLDFNLHQFKGTNNRPVGKAYGGEFSFTLDFDTKDAITLIDWMVSSTIQKDGHIEILDFTNSRIAFKLEFANAYATAQEFYYSAFSNLPLQTNVTVTAGALRFNREVTFFQNWNSKGPFTVQSPSVVREATEEDFDFSEYYFEDLNGNRIEQSKIRYQQEVYLVVSSQNATGKTITLDLDDNRLDYEYQGKIIENDILSNLKISADTMKIKLKAIRQN